MISLFPRLIIIAFIILVGLWFSCRIAYPLLQLLCLSWQRQDLCPRQSPSRWRIIIGCLVLAAGVIWAIAHFMRWSNPADTITYGQAVMPKLIGLGYVIGSVFGLLLILRTLGSSNPFYLIWQIFYRTMLCLRILVEVAVNLWAGLLCAGFAVLIWIYVPPSTITTILISLISLVALGMLIPLSQNFTAMWDVITEGSSARHRPFDNDATAEDLDKVLRR